MKYVVGLGFVLMKLLKKKYSFASLFLLKSNFSVKMHSWSAARPYETLIYTVRVYVLCMSWLVYMYLCACECEHIMCARVCACVCLYVLECLCVRENE